MYVLPCLLLPTKFQRITFEARKLRDVDDVFQDEATLRKIRNVVSAYVNDRGVSYNPMFVRLICPLAATISDEAELFAAFSAVMDNVGSLEPLDKRSAKCMSMVREVMPDLYVMAHCFIIPLHSSHSLRSYTLFLFLRAIVVFSFSFSFAFSLSHTHSL